MRVLVALLLLASTALGFTIDEKSSEVTLLVFKKGVLSGFAHDHEIGAPKLSGTIAFVATDVSASQVTLTIDARELVVRDKELSDSDKKKVAETMRGDEVLDVAHFPTVTFTSQTVVAHAKDAKGRLPLTVIGALTLHGVSKQHRIDVLLEETKDGLVVTGEHAWKQSEHGMKPYSAGLGTIGVKDEVKLVFTIKATGRPEGAPR